MLEMWVIYDSPSDYPGKFVARLFVGEQPTSSVIVADADDLDRLRQHMERMGLACLTCYPDDDPVIVEVWL